MHSDRKKEIIGICLQAFVQNGLSDTSMRALGRALGLDPTALYAHFETKDEVIIACAEEAAVRIEENLVSMALKDIENPEALISNLYARSKEMKPLMKFFVSVCALAKYEEAMRPVLMRLSKRYNYYVEKFAQKLKCEPKDIAPSVYIVINTMSSYMLFGGDEFAAPQVETVKQTLNRMLDERDAKQR